MFHGNACYKSTHAMLFYLQWAQIKLRSKVYTNPARATTVFEEDLIKLMQLASEARIPNDKGGFLFLSN